MRIVLDTNIPVGALITSVAQIDEVADVLARPRMRRFVDPEEAAQMVAAIRRRATVLGVVPVPRRSPDPKDDAILAAAVAGRAALVVSGDKDDMLALGDVEGIPIRSARDALGIVAEGGSGDA